MTGVQLAPVEDVVAAVKEGLTHAEMALRFRCSADTIAARIRWARAHGLLERKPGTGAMRRLHRPRTSRADVTYEEIMRLKAEGMTGKQIAWHFNCSQRLIGERLAEGACRAPVKPRPPVIQPGMSALEADLVQAKGYRDLAKIADKHGLTFAQVQQRWHRIRQSAS